MSIMILSNTGLVPVSQAISGAVSKWSLTMLFVSAGVLILLVTLWAAPQPEMRTFSENMVAGTTDPEAEATQTGDSSS